MEKFFLRIKSLSVRAYAWIVNVVKRAKTLSDKLCPVAIGIVDELKTINESTTGDAIQVVLSAVIPGVKDDAIIAAVRKFLTAYLPEIAVDLRIIDAVNKGQSESDTLKQICTALNVLPDSAKGSVYHSIASKFIELSSDGKFTWSDAVVLAECYFQSKKNDGK
jgi:hypothetical protein